MSENFSTTDKTCNFEYFVGDIAFRFLQYTQSQNDEVDVTDDNFTIPTSVTAGAYSIPSDYADDMGLNDIDLSNLTVDTSHVTVCDINQEMLSVGKSRADEAGITSGNYTQTTFINTYYLPGAVITICHTSNLFNTDREYIHCNCFLLNKTITSNAYSSWLL
jgi:hypothetical protein